MITMEQSDLIRNLLKMQSLVESARGNASHPRSQGLTGVQTEVCMAHGVVCMDLVTFTSLELVASLDCETFSSHPSRF